MGQGAAMLGVVTGHTGPVFGGVAVAAPRALSQGD